MEEEKAIELKSFTSQLSDNPATAEAGEFDSALNLITCVNLEAGDYASESLNTIKKILNNIISDPSNLKFRRLRLSNPAISEKIGQYDSCIELLQVRVSQLVGFRRVQEDNEEILFAENCSQELMTLCVLDRIVESLESIPEPPKPAKSGKDPVREKREMLARVHESRLKTNSTAYGLDSLPQVTRTPETFLQLNEYRRKQKQSHPRQARVMTLSDLDREAESFPAPSPVPTNHSVSDFSNARNIGLRAFQLVVSNQTNEFRATQQLPPLTWHEGMTTIGEGHSTNMGNGTVPFGHEGFNKRFRSFPFRFTRSGAENVAMSNGFGDPAKVAVDGWIKSPGHRKNMLGDFNYTGIGVVQARNGAWYFTQLFALAN